MKLNSNSVICSLIIASPHTQVYDNKHDPLSTGRIIFRIFFKNREPGREQARVVKPETGGCANFER